MPNFKSMIQRTKEAFIEPWDVKDWFMSPGKTAIFAVMHTIVSLTYGLNFIIHGVVDPTGPLIYFVSLLSVPTWGWLVVFALLVFVVGFMLRKSLPITIGTLLCAAVWVGISLCCGIGVIGIGDGWRFAVPVFYIAGVWLLFFFMQLHRMRPNGD